MEEKKRIIIGVSGASGAPLALDCLKELKEHQEIETHLVVTGGGERTIAQELGMGISEFLSCADVVYDNRDIGAAIASGTYRTVGMMVVPCSMKTAAGIACGFSDNLLLRAADVTLKEKRRLVLAVRETPLNAIHLHNLSTLTMMSEVTILPPVLTYYNNPETLQEMTHHITCKILDQFGVSGERYQRWKE